MSKDKNQLTLFERILDSKIEVLPTLPRKQTLDSNYQRMILIKSNELCYAIGNAMNQDGRVYYKTSVSPDKLMRYTSNGQYSSMLKGEKGFGGHEGFEIVSAIEKTSNLMNHVAPILNYKLAEIYYEAYAETNRLFNENQKLLTQLQNTFIVPQVNALRAEAESLQEVYEDISQISKSEILKLAKYTNLDKTCTELKKIFYNSISQIEQELSYKNFNNVASNYFIARHALSHHVFALSLKNIVAGLIDDESMKALKNKVEKAFSRFNQITDGIKKQLSSIQNSNIQTQQDIWKNPVFGWWYNGWNNQPQHDPYQQNELKRLDNENIDIENIKNNCLSYFDIEKDREVLVKLIEAPKQYLQNIVITHEEK
ncbi:hypothetical protein KVM02_05950 [Helicobacter pylori]|nr:hypothetical protein KVM02_05950 [Helicobacter pylori]